MNRECVVNAYLLKHHDSAIAANLLNLMLVLLLLLSLQQRYLSVKIWRLGRLGFLKRGAVERDSM